MRCLAIAQRAARSSWRLCARVEGGGRLLRKGVWGCLSGVTLVTEEMVYLLGSVRAWGVVPCRAAAAPAEAFTLLMIIFNLRSLLKPTLVGL